MGEVTEGLLTAQTRSAILCTENLNLITHAIVKD